MISGGKLRLRMLTVPERGDIGGQGHRKAILPYRTTESAPFNLRLQYVTQIGTINDS